MTLKRIIISIIPLLAFSLELFITSINKGALYYRFFSSGIIYFFMSLLYFYYNDKNTNLWFALTPALFTFLITVHSYTVSENIYFLVLGVSMVIAVLFAFYLTKVKRNKKPYALTYVLLLSLLTYVYASLIFGENQEIKEVNLFETVSMVDEKETSFDIKRHKGKVLVFNLWSTSCGVCIKKFPDYDKEYAKYKDDSDVELYTLHLPLKGDKLDYVKKITEKFSFTKLYAQKLKSWKTLDVKDVPLTIIVDKNGKIMYRGRMNLNKYFPYNNLNSLIEKIKNG